MTLSPSSSSRVLTVFGVTFRDRSQLGRCLGLKSLKREDANEKVLRRRYLIGLTDGEITDLLRERLKEQCVMDIKKRELRGAR